MSRQKSILGETGILLPSRWNSDMTHHIRRDHVPSSVSWNSANIQQNVVGNLAMLEPVFFAPFLKYAQAKLNQRRCSLKCFPQFCTDRFAMHNTIRFSFFLVMVAHQLHTQVRDSGFQSMPFEVFIDRNVSPSSFCTWNKFFGMIVHQIRLNCWLRRMSFLSAQ